MINKFTFGNSPAALVLAAMVNEQNYPTNKISKILNGYSTMVNAIKDVDLNHRITLVNILYTQYKQGCDSLPTPFNTYTKNVLNTTHKKWYAEHYVGRRKNKRNELNNGKFL